MISMYLKMKAQSTGVEEHTDRISAEWYDSLIQPMSGMISFVEALGNVEYPFITIATRPA